MEDEKYRKELGIRLKNFRESIGLTQSDVADSLKMAPNSISAAEARGSVTPQLVMFYKQRGLSVDWLYSGEGEMLVSEAIATYNSAVKPQGKGIPLYDIVAGAGGGAFLDSYKQTGFLDLTVLPSGKPVVAISVRGDSMEPTIRNGSIVLISKLEAYNTVKPDNIYVVFTRDEVLIKRLWLDRNRGEMECISDNPRYKPYPVPVSDICDLYRVEATVMLF